VKLIKIIIIVVVILVLIWLVLASLFIKHIDYCNGILGIDYGAATDGPYDYVQLPTFKTIAKCGGYCMVNDCSKTCPPPNWTCK